MRQSENKEPSAKDDHPPSVLEYTDEERTPIIDRPIIHSQELPDLLQNHGNAEKQTIHAEESHNVEPPKSTLKTETHTPESANILTDTEQDTKHPPIETGHSEVQLNHKDKPKERDKTLNIRSPTLLRFLKGATPPDDGDGEEKVTLVSSERSEGEDEEFYPNRGDPFSDVETESIGAAAGFEWDPDNRG